MIKISV